MSDDQEITLIPGTVAWEGRRAERAEAERDTAVRQLANADAECNRWMEKCEEFKAERDAALAKVANLQDSITKVLAEIEDAGPKALKYAEQELRKGLCQ